MIMDTFRALIILGLIVKTLGSLTLGNMPSTLAEFGIESKDRFESKREDA
jgi:hypothetical protein